MRWMRVACVVVLQPLTTAALAPRVDAALVISGEHDRMVPPAHARTYHDELPEAARFELVDGAGHAVHLEQPDRVADRVIEFHKQHPDEFADARFAEAQA